jgi:hypothetical protein
VRRTLFVVNNGNRSGTRYASDDRRVVTSTDILHFGQGQLQSVCHFASVEVSAAKIEFPNLEAPNRFSLELVIAIPLVLREHDPRSLGSKSKPSLISSATLKVIAVAHKSYIAIRQGFHDWFAVVQVLIQEEDEIVKLQLLWFPIG